MADVVLFKSEDMKPEDDMAVCKECGRKVKADAKVCAGCGAEMKKAAQAAKEKDMADQEQVAKLQKDLDAAKELAKEEADKRAAVEKALKEQGDTIASLTKRLNDAEDSAKLAEFRKTVDGFEHLPVKADVFAPVLKKCAEALDADGFKELMRVLKAADNASAGNFGEIGAPGFATVERSAAEEVDAKAEEIVTKSAGKISKLDATAQVMAQNPKLAQRARRESFSPAN